MSDAALRLRAAAPKEFDRFVEVMDVYATEVTIAVTEAAQSDILNQQGRAQAFLSLLKLYRECHIPHANRTKSAM